MQLEEGWTMDDLGSTEVRERQGCSPDRSNTTGTPLRGGACSPSPVSVPAEAAALAAAVPALGLARTTEEVASIAARLTWRDPPHALATSLELIAGRAVAEDELLVASEAFADHLSSCNEGNDA